MAKTLDVRLRVFVYDHDDDEDVATDLLFEALGVGVSEQPLGDSILVVDASVLRVQDGECY